MLRIFQIMAAVFFFVFLGLSSNVVAAAAAQSTSPEERGSPKKDTKTPTKPGGETPKKPYVPGEHNKQDTSYSKWVEQWPTWPGRVKVQTANKKPVTVKEIHELLKEQAKKIDGLGGRNAATMTFGLRLKHKLKHDVPGTEKYTFLPLYIGGPQLNYIWVSGSESFSQKETVKQATPGTPSQDPKSKEIDDFLVGSDKSMKDGYAYYHVTTLSGIAPWAKRSYEQEKLQKYKSNLSAEKMLENSNKRFPFKPVASKELFDYFTKIEALSKIKTEATAAEILEKVKALGEAFSAMKTSAETDVERVKKEGSGPVIKSSLLAADSMGEAYMIGIRDAVLKKTEDAFRAAQSFCPQNVTLNMTDNTKKIMTYHEKAFEYNYTFDSVFAKTPLGSTVHSEQLALKSLELIFLDKNPSEKTVENYAAETEETVKIKVDKKLIDATTLVAKLKNHLYQYYFTKTDAEGKVSHIERAPDQELNLAFYDISVEDIYCLLHSEPNELCYYCAASLWHEMEDEKGILHKLLQRIEAAATALFSLPLQEQVSSAAASAAKNDDAIPSRTARRGLRKFFLTSFTSEMDPPYDVNPDKLRAVGVRHKDASEKETSFSLDTDQTYLPQFQLPEPTAVGAPVSE